jgi:hypothetical protein
VFSRSLRQFLFWLLMPPACRVEIHVGRLQSVS